VRACLSHAGIEATELAAIAVNWSEPFHSRFLYDLAIHPPFKPWAAPIAVYGKLLEECTGHDVAAKVQFCAHQQSHLWSAFWPSGFTSSLVVSLDGAGDAGSSHDVAGAFAIADRDGLRLLDTLPFDQSLGFFYTKLIATLGYKQFDEYKVMGLAPYGSADGYLKPLLASVVEREAEGVRRLVPESRWLASLRQADLMAVGSRKDGVHSPEQQDFAASVQALFEDLFFEQMRKLRATTGQTRLCFAGGVAANCAANGRLYKERIFDEMFVQPAAGDMGGALGAAYAVSWELGLRPGSNGGWFSPFLGTAIDTDMMQSTMQRWSDVVSASLKNDIVATAADLLADGKVIGWCQGRSEFGPRALGNRSILADPRPSANKDRINYMVKKREGYRPFAPSVAEEATSRFFETVNGDARFPYMAVVLGVQDRWRNELGAVTHVDGSARVQTVSAEQNERYWRLLRAFGERTKIPMLLNTSFNNHAEPIVDSAEDAMVCFLTTGIDYLVLGDYLVAKNPEVRWPDKVFDFGCMLQNYKLVQRSTAAGKQWQVESISGSAFARATYAVTPEAWICLSAADPSESLRQTAKKLGIAASGDLAHEINTLWQDRVIRLTPLRIQATTA